MLPAHFPIKLSIARGDHPLNVLALPVQKLLNFIGALRFGTTRLFSGARGFARSSFI